MNLTLGFAGGQSAATKANPDILDGEHPFENKITSLTLFVVDIDSNKDLIWTNVKYATVPLNSTDTEDVEAEVHIKTTIGKKYVYVGANMTPAQQADFVNYKGNYTSPGETYRDVIGDFVNDNRGIVMFGQVKNDGADPDRFVIEVIDPGGNNPQYINVEVEVERAVSKVALTYTPDGTLGDGYAYAKLATGVTGFIKSDNIYFMLNNTSKSIDFVGGMGSKYPELGDGLFPDYSTHYNYKMVDYLIYNNDLVTTNFRRYFYTREKDPTKDFMFYTPSGHVYDIDDKAYNVGIIKYPFETKGQPKDPYHEGIKPYVDNQTHYISSLYCLENTVNTTGMTNSPDEIISMRDGINTRVIVAAKYTPGKIWHYDEDEDPDVFEIIFSATSSADIADAEAKMEDITGDDPEGENTFYAFLKDDGLGDKTYFYYTYAAKEYLVLTDSENYQAANFITYYSGYGYYATLISQPEDEDKADDKSYDLRRNNYYILNANYFTPPGAVYPQDAYMLVNSETTEWKPGKTTNIIVD